MGYLNQRGVLQWKATEKAANGTDTGCFDVDLAKWSAAVEDLSRLVFGIKSRATARSREDPRRVGHGRQCLGGPAGRHPGALAARAEGLLRLLDPALRVPGLQKVQSESTCR